MPLFYGALGESRTPDLLVRSQLLYPAELRARGGRNIPTDGGSVNSSAFLLCLGTYRSPQLPVMPPSDVSLFFAISALSLARSSSTPLVARTLSISFSV